MWHFLGTFREMQRHGIGVCCLIGNSTNEPRRGVGERRRRGGGGEKEEQEKQGGRKRTIILYYIGECPQEKVAGRWASPNRDTRQTAVSVSTAHSRGMVERDERKAAMGRR